MGIVCSACKPDLCGRRCKCRHHRLAWPLWLMHAAAHRCPRLLHSQSWQSSRCTSGSTTPPACSQPSCTASASSSSGSNIPSKCLMLEDMFCGEDTCFVQAVCDPPTLTCQIHGTDEILAVPAVSISQLWLPKSMPDAWAEGVANG